MERSELRGYIRIFYAGILGIVLLFGAALLSSFVGSFGRPAPDAAYGDEELTDANFTLPAEPQMVIWVWEKDEAEMRELVTLDARTPVNSGPSVAWGAGSTFQTLYLPFEQDGLTISVQAEGQITARWEHASGSDCGYTHPWWYSVDPDLTGGVDTIRLRRTYDASAEGTNSLCLLWRGQGGQPADTLTAEGVPVSGVRHSCITLADVIGEDGDGLHETVTQDSMTIYIYLECRNLLGRLTAAATLKVTMVSGWYGAAALYEAERPAVILSEETGGSLTSRWIGYAAEPPVWTVELVGYREQ